MKSVLISIHPKWCELIASGKKGIEVRKTKPNIETPFKCYIYQTIDGGAKGDILVSNKKVICGKVLGEFTCDKVYEYPFNWEEFTAYGIKTYKGIAKHEKLTCVSQQQIIDYACKNGHAEKLYGIHISDLKIYDRPKELSEFRRCIVAHLHSSCKDCAFENSNECVGCGTYKTLTRPPQSWCYVEDFAE